MADAKKARRKGRVKRRPGHDKLENQYRPLPGEHPQGLERQARGSRSLHGPRHLPAPSPEHLARAVAEGEGAVNILTRETKRAQIEAARRDPRAFIEYAFGLRQEWFHDEWQTLFDDHENAFVIAARGHGKCVPDDGLVTIASGERVRAADLPEHFDALSWSEGTGWVSRPAHKFADQVQPIVEICTRSGRLLRVSPEHPVWTDGEWVAVRDVGPGHGIAVVPEGARAGRHLARDTELGWDQVVGVNDAPPERTWSIEVEGTHAVIVDDVVTHNTTQVIGRLLWEFGRNVDLRVKLVCASDSKANERVQEIREHIQRNPRVSEVFPHLEPADDRDWTKRKLTLRRNIISRDVSLEALGIGSSVTGGRAELLIFDDICDERNTLRFPELREQIKRTFKIAFTPVLEPLGSRTWYLATLYHASDNSHELILNGRYACECHAHLNEDDGGERAWAIVRHDVGVPGDDLRPLWPTRWARSRLGKRRVKMGPVEFDRAYRNIALSGEVQIVSGDWIVYEAPPPLDDLVTFQAYDLADGENPKADAFAGVTIGVPLEWPPGKAESLREQAAVVARAGNEELARMLLMQAEAEAEEFDEVDHGPSPIWVLDAFALRVPFGDQVRKIIQWWVEYEALHVGIEKVTCEGVSAQVQREPGAPPLPLFRLRPVKSKARRLNGVSPLIQSGRVRFAPHLNPATNPALVHLGCVVSELTQFPVAKHDDLVDAIVYALLLLMRWEAVSRKAQGEVDSAVGVRVLGAAARRGVDVRGNGR